MIRSLLAAFVLAVAVSAEAQVLTTAEPLGNGSQLVLLAENRLDDQGVGLNIAYALYAKNLKPKFDLYASVGETHILGEGQVFVGVGGNLKLFGFKGNSVSLFTMASTPLHRRSESCVVLLNPAVVVSRVLNSKISLYSGINSLIRIRPQDDDLFTPLENKLNVPAGVALTLGSWGFYAEGNFGNLHAVGIGLSKVF